MKIDLSKIEEKLKDFFEKDLQIVAHKNPLQSLSKQIITSLEKNLNQIDDQIYAPNIYRISLKEEDFINKNDLVEWKQRIQGIIRDIARENGFRFSGPIHIQVFANPKIITDFEVSVSSSSIANGKTVNLFSNGNGSRKPKKVLEGYLILPDDTYHPINKTILNIGRREDNDLIIDNLRVSRVHAQIRQIEDQHIVFDLDSTAGTKVNSVKIRQHALNPGDVIEIADTPLIYGNEIDTKLISNNKHKTRMLSSEKKGKKQ